MTPRRRFRDRFPETLRVGDRRLRAEMEAARLRRRGQTTTPVVIDGREIATTFWGKAWCRNLERYSDFENRLPRGRSYVRSGAVIDLRIQPGRVDALVSGSDLYRVQIDVTAVPPEPWRAIVRDLSGRIGSVIELLAGELSTAVMTRLSEPGRGLFPTSDEISFRCSCPDAASMCKHIAAVLYGIGARLDREPSLLFTLRHVREDDLVAKASDLSGLVRGRAAADRKTIAESELGTIFGIDIAPAKGRRRRG